MRSGRGHLGVVLLAFLVLAGAGLFFALRNEEDTADHRRDGSRSAGRVEGDGGVTRSAAERAARVRARAGKAESSGTGSQAGRTGAPHSERSDAAPPSAGEWGESEPGPSALLRVRVDPRDRLERLWLHVRSPGIVSFDEQPVVGDVAEFVVPANELRLRLEHPAALPLNLARSVDAGDVIEISYPEVPVAEPVVVAVVSPRGQPVAGATLWIERWDRGRALRTRVGVTDDHGVAAVRGLEIAGTALNVESEAFAVERLDPAELHQRLEAYRSAGDSELVIALREGGVVVVTVQDDRGRPVEGARVSVESPSVSAARTWRRIEVNTDAEGRARLEPITAARIELRVWDLILGVTRTAPFDVPAGEAVNVTVTYEEHVAVSGRVRVNGDPAVGGEVYFGGVSQSGDFMPVREGGRFSGRVRRSRTALLHYVRRDPRVVVHHARSPVVGDEEILFDYRGADLRVKIATPPSGETPTYRVRVVSVEGELHSAAAQNVQGSVLFRAVPLGRYQIIVHREGTAVGHLQSPIVDLTADLQVDVGYRETEAIAFSGTVAPVDVRAWAYPDDGGREAVTVLRTFPLEVAWPREVKGWLALEARGVAPEFTRVDARGAAATSFGFEPGGTLLPIESSSEAGWSCRVTPQPMLGPPEFWDRDRRVGLPLALRPGSYRVDWRKDGQPVASEVVSVAATGVTEVRADD